MWQGGDKVAKLYQGCEDSPHYYFLTTYYNHVTTYAQACYKVETVSNPEFCNLSQPCYNLVTTCVQPIFTTPYQGGDNLAATLYFLYGWLPTWPWLRSEPVIIGSNWTSTTWHFSCHACRKYYTESWNFQWFALLCSSLDEKSSHIEQLEEQLEFQSRQVLYIRRNFGNRGNMVHCNVAIQSQNVGKSHAHSNGGGHVVLFDYQSFNSPEYTKHIHVYHTVVYIIFQ